MEGLDYLVTAIRNTSEPHEIRDGYYAVLPEGTKIHDLERFLPWPLRKRANIVVHDPESFVAYFNRHRTSASIIFADQNKVRIAAVMDHHAPRIADVAVGQEEAGDGGFPGHREHHLTYTAPHSPEWLVWTGQHGRLMPQTGFAQFIEDNVVDIVSPTGAEMLELAQSFEAKQNVAFRSSVRLDRRHVSDRRYYRYAYAYAWR